MRSPLDNLCPHLSRKGRQDQEHPMQGHDTHSKLRKFPVGDTWCVQDIIDKDQFGYQEK